MKNTMTFDDGIWTIDYKDGHEHTAYRTGKQMQAIYAATFESEDSLCIIGFGKNRNLDDEFAYPADSPHAKLDEKIEIKMKAVNAVKQYKEEQLERIEDRVQGRIQCDLCSVEALDDSKDHCAFGAYWTGWRIDGDGDLLCLSCFTEYTETQK